MRTHPSPLQSSSGHSKKTPWFNIIPLLIVIVAGCLITTLFLVGSRIHRHSTPITHTISLTIHATPAHTLVPTLTPTSRPNPTPTPFTPQADPAPITPFPNTMPQQISTLEAHDRFFYHGNPALPEIALTFDDGPNPASTPQVLEILKQFNIKATFFCIGQHVQQYPDLVRQEFADGNIVGNHTWDHPNLAITPAAKITTELTTTSDAIQRVTGTRPTFFRPPYGSINANALTTINQQGLTIFQWNDDAKDWTLPPPAVIATRIITTAHDGTIILLHDGGGDRSRTVAALPTIITQLQARSFHFVTLAQLVADAHKTTSATTSSPTGLDAMTNVAQDASLRENVFLP